MFYGHFSFSGFRRCASVLAVASILAFGSGVRPAAATTTFQTTPLPTGTANSHLTGVSCTSSTNCVAVGNAYVSGTQTPLVLRWNRTTWTLQTTPLPTGTATSHLTGVSCTSSTNCVAVGHADVSGTYTPLVLRWNGVTWMLQNVQLPTGTASSLLSGVSCASSTNCVAVGQRIGANGFYRSLVLRWNGATWMLQSAPLPTGTTGYNELWLSGVSCTSTTNCVAVGTASRDSDSRYQSWAVRWNGTAWTRQNIPLSSGTTESWLSGVSCTSSTNCVAVGWAYGVWGDDSPLVLRWNGTNWKNHSDGVPVPLGTTGSGLSGVSCTSSANCVAVGYARALGTTRRLFLRWSGAGWTLRNAYPTGTTYSTLSGVSCTSSTDFIAVGSWETRSSYQRLVLRYTP